MTPEWMILVLWVAWLVSWVVAAFWSNRTEKRAGIVVEIAFRILFCASVTLLLAPFSDRHYYAQVQFWHLDAALKWILVALAACPEVDLHPGLFFYPNQHGLLAWAFVHLSQDSSRFLARLRFTAICLSSDFSLPTQSPAVPSHSTTRVPPIHRA